MWIKGNEAVHVGDSLEDDIQGAKNAGMKTVWIKRKKEVISIHPNFVEEVMNIHPDFVISKVTELPSIF